MKGHKPPHRNPTPPEGLVPNAAAESPGAEIDKVVKALNGIADAIREQAQATVLLARATSGEFDEAEEGPDLHATPLPDGYRGMGG